MPSLPSSTTCWSLGGRGSEFKKAAQAFGLRTWPLLNVAMLALLIGSATCCTYVEIPFPGGSADGSASYMIARTLELGNLGGRMSYDIEVVPPSASGGSFGYIAPMNIFHLLGQEDKIAVEGTNERGLTVSALAFSESIYEEASHQAEENLPFALVVPTLLANCESLEAALRFLASVRVVRPPGIPIKHKGLHWAITDPSGRSVVVEYLHGTRVVSINEPRVLTNDPNLQWQWRNLNTYSNLSPSFPVQNRFLTVETDHGVGQVPRAIGHGWNLFGLPGDTSPPSRFVRMFYLRGYAMHRSPVKTESDAIVLGTALINNVFIPYGTVAPNLHDFFDNRPEYTHFAMLKSPGSKKMLIRSYRNMQWRQIDMTRLDFRKSQTWPLDDGTLGIRDITGSSVFAAPQEDVSQPLAF